MTWFSVLRTENVNLSQYNMNLKNTVPEAYMFNFTVVAVSGNQNFMQTIYQQLLYSLNEINTVLFSSLVWIHNLMFSLLALNTRKLSKI